LMEVTVEVAMSGHWRVRDIHVPVVIRVKFELARLLRAEVFHKETGDLLATDDRKHEKYRPEVIQELMTEYYETIRDLMTLRLMMEGTTHED
jgi:hypothetical protein